MNSILSLVLLVLVLALAWGVQAGTVLLFESFLNEDCAGQPAVVFRKNPNGKCYSDSSNYYKASCNGITIYTFANCTGDSQFTGTGCINNRRGSTRYICVEGNFFTIATAAGTCTAFGSLPADGFESSVEPVGGCMSSVTGLGVKVDSISGTTAAVTFANDASCLNATDTQVITLGTCFQNPVNQQATIIVATVSGAADLSGAAATSFMVFVALSFIAFS